MNWLKQLDDLLRGRKTTQQDLRAGRLDIPLGGLLVTGVVMGVIYGFFMGWFAVSTRESDGPMQMIASMVKLPALFFLTLLVTMPSLYVFSALCGSRFDFGSTVRLLVAAVVVNLTVAASLGPILGFFTVSTTSYSFMILLNVGLLAIAGVVALGFLLQILRRMAAPPPEPDDPTSSGLDADWSTYAAHRRAKTIFNMWLVIYGLVGMQMGWLLRPFIGDPDMPFEWLRPRAANFFSGLMAHVRELLGG